ncbi:MAG: xanthine dehydrogenase family protein molybdopterin-binding subunit [Phycisphaerales bacterium]|nr:MAG: xanthine dehydrogenase family protein molybdopterin-binding subunit [Phycisphaerales bacterium]
MFEAASVATPKRRTKKDTLIGRRIPKLDAPEKATGLARYIEDLNFPRMLYGKILFADRPHARIVSIDTSAARAMRGVRAVITAADINLVPFGYGQDNTALKADKVTCIRDEVAAVAADTPEIAAEAVKRIRVTYEDLPVVASPEEAVADGAPIIHEKIADNTPFRYDYSHGDIEAGVGDSHIIVEDTYTLQRQAHCCLGTSGIIASFDADGRLTLHSLTQVPFLYKNDLARIVGVAPEKIRIIQPPIGGGFGSKLDIHPFEPICIFLAMKTSRPVKLVFTREEEFLATPTRQNAVIYMRSGARKDGTFTFRDVRMTLDNGGRTSWGATTPWIMMRSFSSLYRVPHVRQHADIIYTNNIYACAFRGYGNPQATFALESQIDQLADELGMDPLDVRLINAQKPGETTGQGMVLRTCGLKECLETSAANAGWETKRREAEASRNQQTETPNRAATVRERTKEQAGIACSHCRSMVRGVGMASFFHVGGGAKIYRSDGCGTILKLDDFGAVTVLTGSSEIGQGSETVLAQIVAEGLGLPMKNIRVINNDTELTPWDVGVHASRTTFIAGNSVLRAAREARRKLLAAAAARLKREPDQLDLSEGKVVDGATGEALESIGKIIRGLHFGSKNELIMTTDFYEPPSTAPDEDQMGDISACYAFGTHVAEVEVDLDTGVVKVIKVCATHDVGRVINRLGLEGQIEGGIVQGLGYCLSEEVKVSEGRVLNPSFTDYKLMTTWDVPEMELSFVETNDPAGPYGAKGVGESPLIPVAAAVANAVYNAAGVRIRELPLTPEKVLAHLKAASRPAE